MIGKFCPLGEYAGSVTTSLSGNFSSKSVLQRRYGVFFVVVPVRAISLVNAPLEMVSVALCVPNTLCL